MKIDINGGRDPISTEPVDVAQVWKAAIKAVELVIEDSEDYSTGLARGIFEPLTNDERILLQSVLKSAKPEGTRKTYYSCFCDHLKLEKDQADDRQ